MKCFYINLDDAIDRRNCIEENFSIYKTEKWHLTRFPAIDTEYVIRNNVQGSLSNKEKACLLSHRELIAQNLNDTNDIFILEDDAIFGTNTCHIVEQFIGEMNEKNIEWDILYTDLGPIFGSVAGMLTENRKDFEETNEIKLINLENIAFAGATAYIINGKSKEKIFNLLISEELNTPYDIFLDDKIIKKQKIKSFVIFPFATSLSDLSKESSIQQMGVNNLIQETFRKMAWLDRNIDQPSINAINNTLVNARYDQNVSIFNYAYQINKLANHNVAVDGVDYKSAENWFKPVENTLQTKLIINPIIKKDTTPKIIHFIWMSNGAPFELSLIHYIAIKSAATVNPSYKIILHTDGKPTGLYFDKLKDRIEINYVEPINSVYGIEISRFEHKSDVLRLNILRKMGGVYLDLDIITLRSFDSLLTNKAVMGREVHERESVCNAVVISPKNGYFINQWLKEYKNFHNNQWNEFSCVAPYDLSRTMQDHVSILYEKAFFNPNWFKLDELFEKTVDHPDAYVYHLWNHLAKREGYIQRITVDYIRNVENTFNLIARKYITDL